MQLPPGSEWSKSSARVPDLTTNLALPAGQACISAVLVGFLALAVQLHLGGAFFESLTGAAVIGGAAAVAVWFWSLYSASLALWVWESYSSPEPEIQQAVPAPALPPPDDDDLEGEVMPGRAATRLQVVLPRDGVGPHIKILHLSIDADRLRQFARGILGGRSLSERDWAGRGRPFTIAEFRSLRGELLQREFIAWRTPGSPGQGCELTEDGRALFERLAAGEVRSLAVGE